MSAEEIARRIEVHALGLELVQAALGTDYPSLDLLYSATDLRVLAALVRQNAEALS